MHTCTCIDVILLALIAIHCIHRHVLCVSGHVGEHGCVCTDLRVVPSGTVVVGERYPVSLLLLRGKIHHNYLVNINAGQKVFTGAIVWYKLAYIAHKRTEHKSQQFMCRSTIKPVKKVV